MTVQSSGPRGRPVSASRSALRSPPTAFSSRTISFGAGAVRAQLLEALERRPRLLLQRDRLGLEHLLRELARLDRDRARRAEPGRAPAGRPTRSASSSSDMAAIASIASRRIRGRS